MNRGLKIAQRVGTVLAGLSGLLLFVSAPLIGDDASPTVADEPEITFQNPEDGDVLNEPPFVLQMCFKEPVNVADLDKGGDFRFRLEKPDNMGLGMRIVFQPDGYGVAIFPGLPTDEEIPEGEWTWEYRLTDRVNPEDALEGVVTFEVSATDGSDIVDATPPSCLPVGATARPTAQHVSITPTPAEGDGGENQGEDGGDDVDIGRLALLTIGAAGVAAVLALIGYFIRRRIGYEPHAPHDGEGPPEHH